ncbi:hydrolase [Bacteroidia bacterium]|nr:hydrolase [Bacteroidia bacterium]
MIKNIIFDFGKVLIDWNPSWIFSKIVPAENLDHFMQTVWHDEWNSSLDSGITFVDNERNMLEQYPQYSEYITYFHQHWYESVGEENKGSVLLLNDLQQAGYATYGLSNWSAETFPSTRKAYPFFNTLNGIVLSGEEKVCKPDLLIYRILLNRYQLRPEESVFIDDRQENLDTAQQLGIDTLLFQTAEQVRQSLKQKGVL